MVMKGRDEISLLEEELIQLSVKSSKVVFSETYIIMLCLVKKNPIT